MIPTLSQVCSLSAAWDRCVNDYAAGACPSIELWLGQLETYLEHHTLDEAKRVLLEAGVTAPVASFQGGLLVSQGAARREHGAHFQKRLALLSELGTRTLVVAADLVGPLNAEDLERAKFSLQQSAEMAGASGVRLALEFQSGATLVNNLETAAALVGEIGHPALGICLDLFHYYCGPSKFEDLAWLTPENLFHVQVCDVADRPREFASDADRILPGEGGYQISPLLQRLRESGYTGTVSLELMNPQIWQTPPRQFGEIAMTAMRMLLGQASMGRGD